MTLARAFVTGLVVKSPEKRFTQNDMAIASFTVNIVQNNETLLRVSAFGQLADNIASSIAQGDSVAVEGKLQVNSYKLPNGKDKRVYEINANSVEKISASTAAASNEPVFEESENLVSVNQDEIAQDLIDEDEIPF